ncbi:MAG: riboflavin biosynthesis protein RibF [Bacteroides sp.]|nr:riboflavin biosynthesis protein RibF [Bacteroides sp.]MCM1378875.1 riboflavin biosynthesis protein RibF [Bacteroides sp.]MCM1445491.1 riboflavin biosynthesis protein RibF [Prevotella sp.]
MKAAVIGTFDGVHRGHRFLLDRLKAEAKKRGLEPLAITFSAHPLAQICPEKQPPALSTLEERLRLIGISTEVLDFDYQLRQMTARGFLAMLRNRFDVSLFLLGFNNTIGSDRLGVRELAGKTVDGVEILAVSEYPTLSVSSSAIRQALADGNITMANRMLGRPYSLTGTVVHGKQLGRTIGFPTANIAPPASMTIPVPGVYAARIGQHTAVVNIGRRPTVDAENAPISIEAHIVNFNGDLYGQTLTVEFIARLRDEKKFSSLDELEAAISNDITQTLKYEQ